jgi:hypothetical protein
MKVFWPACLVLVFTIPCFGQDTFSPTLGKTGDDVVVLYIYWAESSGLYRPTVIIDGIEIARLRGNHVFGVKLAPGEHFLTLSGSETNPEPLRFKVDAGKTYYARMRRSAPGLRSLAVKNVTSVVLTEESRAIKEMKKLKPVDEKDVQNHEMIIEFTGSK